MAAVAVQPGVWSLHGFSGRPTGLSAAEARARMPAEGLDGELVRVCLTAFEAGFLAGMARAEAEKDKSDEQA